MSSGLTAQPPATSATTDAVKVNVGSGGEAVAGWINVDKSPALLLARMTLLRRALARIGILTEQQVAGFSRAVVYGNATGRLRFAPDSIDYVYSSHMIEHLSREQGLRFLLEARRILTPGGVIRLATPDLASLISRYRAGDATNKQNPPGDALMSSLGMFRQLEAGVLRRLISRNFSSYWHQWLYDEGSLGALLHEAGFHESRRMPFRSGDFPDLELIEFRGESLFVQARAER